VYEEKILVPKETRKICAHFDVDPLQLISSGSLLVIAEKEKTDEILGNLSRNGVQTSVIGEVTEPASGRNLIIKTGKKTELVRPVNDHLWKALAKPAKT
ncbi:AIR synthase-related protein, partial [Candidatus Bathyarchaeota archaeon]|nr:AIR synthase-related protein [Candidatus Bathyarchaeota archaeon]